MHRKQKYIPHQVIWEMTLHCNLRCLHCGSSAGKPRQNELTTTEAIQLCQDLKEINTQEVCLIGGEPFLRKDFYTIAKKIKKLNMKLLIISNGYSINKKIISQLKQLKPHAIALSLDGSTAKTHDFIRRRKGSFHKIVECLTLMKEANLPITIITTVNKLNIRELPLIWNLISNKQIAWQIQVATPEGRFTKKHALSKEEYYSVALFIASLKKKYPTTELPVIGAHCFGYHSTHLPCLGLFHEWGGCQAGLSILSIKSNGDVIGCLSAPHTLIEGNIREKSIAQIWNDSEAFAYNRAFKTTDLGPHCKGCRFGETCKGGCMGMSVGFTSLLHNHPYCFHRIEPELFSNEK